MDEITNDVREMYSRYPYPSPETGKTKLKELSNLLQILKLETGYDFPGKRVLDAGTGTGRRLLEAARTFPKTDFVAVDMTEVSLNHARHEATRANLRNVEFRAANLMGDFTGLGKFDIVMCMGVLHHLANPDQGLRNLAGALKEDGFTILYLYGLLGGLERMRRKEIVTTLLGSSARRDFERGVQLVKDLQFDSLEYGWNLSAADEAGRDGLIVDAYMNVNEKLYDAPMIDELVRNAGFHGYVIYGLSTNESGIMFDTALDSTPAVALHRTDPREFLRTPMALEMYGKLDLVDKYRVIDLFTRPNGYTVICLTERAFTDRRWGERITANFVRCKR